MVGTVDGDMEVGGALDTEAGAGGQDMELGGGALDTEVVVAAGAVEVGLVDHEPLQVISGL